MRSLSVIAMAGILVLTLGNVYAQDQRGTVFPQIAVGGGWSSDFFLNNQGFEPITGVKLAFFDNNGNPLVVQTGDLGSASSFTFNLAAGSTRVITANITGNTVYPGYVELTSPPKTPLRATMVVRFVSGGQVSTQLGVTEQFPFDHFSFAGEVKKSAGINTGLALANASLGSSAVVAQDLLISLLNENGAITRTVEYTLDVGEHISFFLDDPALFPGLDNYRGTVIVSAPDLIGVLALRLEGGALGTLSVNEGAVLAPFFLTSTPIQEAETNDTMDTAQALTLPLVVSGVISSQSDKDYFKFTGHNGDIVDLMVETVSLPAASELDSEVYLLNSAGATVAWSDQNGLRGYPENDSFIRTVLPADGTYYIKVWDYWGEYGGSNFTYKLHLKIETP